MTLEMLLRDGGSNAASLDALMAQVYQEFPFRQLDAMRYLLKSIGAFKGPVHLENVQ